MFPRQTPPPEETHRPAEKCTRCGYQLPENWHRVDINWKGMANRGGCHGDEDHPGGYDYSHDWEVIE